VQRGEGNARVEDLSRWDSLTFSSSVSRRIFEISPVEKNRQKKHCAEDADGNQNSVRIFSAAQRLVPVWVFDGHYSAQGQHQREKYGNYGENVPQIEEKNPEETYFIDRVVERNVNLANQMDER